MFSRKFLITVLMLFLSSFLLLGSFIDQDIWFSVVSIATGGYLGANTLSRYGDVISGYRKEKGGERQHGE